MARNQHDPPSGFFIMDFEKFYITWYSRAKRFAVEYVSSESDAENIVQDVFVRIYERREWLGDAVSPVSFLLASVKNKCLDFLRRKTAEQSAADAIRNEMYMERRMKMDSLEAFDTDFSDESEIMELLRQALDKLPERCRRIFIMSKLEGKRQREIAQELHISVNTVESQMAIAYCKLRQELKSRLPILFLLFAIDDFFRF